MFQIDYKDIFHPHTPCYKPKLSHENAYNLLGRDAQFKYIKGPSLRAFSYKYVFFSGQEALGALNFFANKMGKFKDFWIFDYYSTFKIIKLQDNAAYIANSHDISKALVAGHRYFILSSKKLPDIKEDLSKTTLGYKTRAKYNRDYFNTISVFKLLSVKGADTHEILVFDKPLKEYYSDEIKWNMEYYDLEAQPKELNYLCELVPVRFDSDSLTFTQKSPVRYELSLNFKEIIKE
ncbi:MAG: hypothetical protein MR658_02440 [Campylobacter sp.]|uniref:hypothetical protein n=1 Tax=Campylobacter sp. TaxID=205 RepID=UPI002AA645F4|nr:hypothetical protein [Campylobacter sp.]MCI6177681.1 hypothetical protein [Campylobacter sp.]